MKYETTKPMNLLSLILPSVFLAASTPDAVEIAVEAVTDSEVIMPVHLRIPIVVIFGLLGGVATLAYSAQKEEITLRKKCGQPITVYTLIMSGVMALFTNLLVPKLLGAFGGQEVVVEYVMGTAFILGLFAHPVTRIFGGALGMDTKVLSPESK